MLARMHTAAMYSDVAKQEVIVSQARAIAYSDYHDASAAAAQTYALRTIYAVSNAICDCSIAHRIIVSQPPAYQHSGSNHPSLALLLVATSYCLRSIAGGRALAWMIACNGFDSCELCFSL